MPILACTAGTCLYNKQEYCSKGDIKIGGANATDAADTHCDSFVEKTGGSTTNSVGTPSEHIDVVCSACNCVYNDSEICDADKIGISGRAANDVQDTSCGTFSCK
jgi:hypothetical protein